MNMFTERNHLKLGWNYDGVKKSNTYENVDLNHFSCRDPVVLSHNMLVEKHVVQQCSINLSTHQPTGSKNCLK